MLVSCYASVPVCVVHLQVSHCHSEGAILPIDKQVDAVLRHLFSLCSEVGALVRSSCPVLTQHLLTLFQDIAIETLSCDAVPILTRHHVAPY